MSNLFSHYVMTAKRWAWLMVLGVCICGGLTFVISKMMPPVYQASATLVVNADPASPENVTSSIAAIPTYAQLLTSAVVLDPVLARHHGLTMQQLNAMISVKPVASTQLIELNVTNSDPQLAKQLADEISQSFAQYSNAQLPGAVQILPTRVPDSPISPKPSLDAAIGAVVGFSLAIAMIIIFEWLADRLISSQDVQAVLGLEILMMIPRFSARQLGKKIEDIPAMARECRMLCSMLSTSRATKHLKLVMVTSALENEGKSIVAKNVASFLAMMGKRVLLVDANIDRPTIHRYFNLSNQAGFTNVLQEASTWSDVELYIQTTHIANLSILPAGAPLSNFVSMAQLLQADHIFKYFKQASFDYILFDTSPLLPVDDAKMLAFSMQAAILVVDPSKTSRKAVRYAKNVLNRANTTILGAVINKSYWPDSEKYQSYPGDLMQARTALRDSLDADPAVHIALTKSLQEEDTAKLKSVLLNHKPPSENGPVW